MDEFMYRAASARFRVGQLLMAARKVLLALVTCSFLFFAASVQSLFPSLLRLTSLTSVVFAQDLSKTILPVAQVKWIGPGVETKFGTGFCLDPQCRLIVTNYHVAMMARPRKIKGDRVIQRYLATGSDDDGATINYTLSGSPMKFTLLRDLAIFELQQPLPHYHGIPFSLNDLHFGQQVDIYAYPQESLNPTRKLTQFHGAFKGETTGGLLAFDYHSSSGKTLRLGASGGLVVDTKTQQVVGVLSGVARSAELVAVAVPIQSLADFVSKVQPWVAQNLFPSTTKGTIPPTLDDLYPKFVLPPSGDSLQHRPDEPPEVKVLRAKSQLLADSMRNFIAVQTFAWGSRNSQPAAMAEYEVQILDGFQRFREYPDGKEELRNVPFPPVNTMVNPGGEWSELPQMVGTELHLKIRQARDTVINGRQIKVFQYRADAEDDVCVFKSVRDLVFYSFSKTFSVPCYGEVWADEDFNILRISEHLELPGSWRDYQSVVNYGWVRLTEGTPRLVPITISTQAEFKNKVYWCRGLFTNYRMFSSRGEIVANDHVQSLPP